MHLERHGIVDKSHGQNTSTSAAHLPFAKAIDRLRGFSVMKDRKTQKVTLLTWIEPRSGASNYSTNFFNKKKRKKRKKGEIGELCDKKGSWSSFKCLKDYSCQTSTMCPTLLFSILGFCEISLNI